MKTILYPPVGIIDIGSNALRFVIYKSKNQPLIPLYREKLQCELGRHLSYRKDIPEPEVQRLISGLARIQTIMKLFKVGEVFAVATAALRDAQNGLEIIRRIEKELGLKIRRLNGNEESYYGTCGVLASFENAQGLVGDFGGGSLELSVLGAEGIENTTSLPLGGHRVCPLMEKGDAHTRKVLGKQLDQVKWLKETKNQDFYAMGGGWRDLGRLIAKKNQHPINILHGYTVSSAELLTFLKDSLDTLSRGRLKNQLIAAGFLVMETLIKQTKVRSVIFCDCSLREGFVIAQKSNFNAMRQNPALTLRTVFLMQQEMDTAGLKEWLKPYLEKISLSPQIIDLSILLSFVRVSSFSPHEAEALFEQIIEMPYVGINHDDRMLLAYITYVKIGSFEPTGLTRRICALMDKTHAHEAKQLGLLLRLAHTVSCGLKIDQMSKLKLTKKDLTLSFAKDFGHLYQSFIMKPLMELEAASGLKCKLV